MARVEAGGTTCAITTEVLGQASGQVDSPRVKVRLTSINSTEAFDVLAASRPHLCHIGRRLQYMPLDMCVGRMQTGQHRTVVE